MIVSISPRPAISFNAPNVSRPVAPIFLIPLSSANYTAASPCCRA
jgi:hypothetical protein